MLVIDAGTSPLVLRGLRPEQLRALTPRTLAGLTPWQLGALSGEQLAVLSPDQVAAWSTFQVQVLIGTGQIAALSAEGRARLVAGGQLPQALRLPEAQSAIQAGSAWALRQANTPPPALLMQRLPPRPDRPTAAPRPVEPSSLIPLRDGRLDEPDRSPVVAIEQVVADVGTATEADRLALAKEQP